MSEFQNPYMLKRAGISMPANQTGPQRQEYLTKLGEESFALDTRQTLETLSGGATQLKNSFGELGEAIGMGFLPALQDLTAALKEATNGAGSFAVQLGEDIRYTLQGLFDVGVPKGNREIQENYTTAGDRFRGNPRMGEFGNMVGGAIGWGAEKGADIWSYWFDKGRDDNREELYSSGQNQAQVIAARKERDLLREQAEARAKTAADRKAQMRKEEQWKQEDKITGARAALEGLGLGSAISADLDPWGLKMEGMKEKFDKQLRAIAALKKKFSRDPELADDPFLGGMINRLPEIFHKRYELQLKEAQRAQQKEINEFTQGERQKSLIALREQRDRLLKSPEGMKNAAGIEEAYQRQLMWTAQEIVIEKERLSQPASNFAPAAEFGSVEAYKLMHPDVRGDELDAKQQQLNIEKNTFAMAGALETLAKDGIVVKGLEVAKLN
jgi:hypothetical protein